MLEPCDGKLSRTVLRGEGGRKAPDLPGAALPDNIGEKQNTFHFHLDKIPLYGVCMPEVPWWNDERSLSSTQGAERLFEGRYTHVSRERGGV